MRDESRGSSNAFFYTITLFLPKMKFWTTLGKSLSAIFTCAVLGGLSFFSLGHFFPPTPSSTTQISTISIFGGAFAGLIGLCWGWYCAEDFANEAVSKLLELLFLGAAILIIGGVTFLIKAI